MGIINRTKDVTEQRLTYSYVQGALATGVTVALGVIANAGAIQAAQIAAVGVSGAPTFQLAVQRFITGTGYTSITFATGTSNTPADFGTSGAGSFGSSLFGVSGMIIAALGSTLNLVQPNDVLMLVTGGANSAVKNLALTVVIQPTQDLKTFFGIL